MIFTRYCMLAVMFVVLALSVLACGPKSNVFATAMAAVKSADSISIPNIQATTVRQAGSLEHATMVLVSEKAWMQEATGMTVLNIFRTPPVAARTLDGYDDIVLKPKLIKPNNYFAGYGANHNARADV